ncbi:glycosyltransferase family 2 protein [Deinococcus radiotolerans]|uniref:Rhamnosyltransferase n=1 Tax=Deinococcus radiotolerans TaxID=1309407 RepID=A0ABQ2FHC6_9DEIO|nr:glycosyltransferase [Deinococcus radiotolerans]GGK95217.1 rhamnosyltransferase [Deinococcus radiotolerans]
MHKIAIVIPTYNPGSHAISMINAIRDQDLMVSKVVIIDSSSEDGSCELWKDAGFDVISISKSDFDHGASRNLGARMAMDCDILIFMTQDAVPENAETLRNLVEPIISRQADALYARQLARPDASYIESLTRSYNYPAQENQKFALKHTGSSSNGARKYFFSNVCSAYRVEAFKAVGGFEEGIILNEDVVICKRMMDQGYRVGYSSSAKVIHSHEYTIKKDFSRSFDIGVSHSDISALKNLNSEGEGLKYVKFILSNLYINKKPLIPRFILHSFARYMGYYLGKNHRLLGKKISKKFSMHKGYWLNARRSL